MLVELALAGGPLAHAPEKTQEKAKKRQEMPRSTLNLVNAHCLEMWAFRQEELELGPLEGSNYTLLVLHLGADGHCNLAHVDPGHCALGLPKAPCVPVWSLHWGQHGSPECPRPLRAT